MALTQAAEEALRQGIAALPFAVDEAQAVKLAEYLLLLNRWNAVHNLTAVRDQREQVVVHLLDCLAVLPYLPHRGRIADIGSGAGLPALIVALMRPALSVFAVESNHKKSAFIRHAAVTLQLGNIEVIGERVEQWQPQTLPDVIISRAMAAPDLLLELTRHLATSETRWMLMCGQVPDVALDADMTVNSVRVDVPLLDAQRALLMIQRRHS